jgi:outer membrane protein assembly factor BamC
VKPLVRLALWVAGLALAGCSALDNATRIDYRSAAKLPNLEVPPDLVSPRSDDRFAIPSRGQPQTLSGFQSARPERTAEGPRVLPAADGVRVERAGNRRWLSVNLPPERVYPLVREFWQESGFIIQSEMPEVGILETDWAENRAKLSQDFIRNTLGKVFDSLYSTGERDKFRTRLESSGSGATEIFITHRGLVEIYKDTQRSSTVWTPRPSDPELEAEFLSRLMVKLGADQQRARQQVAAAPAAAPSPAGAAEASAAPAPAARAVLVGSGDEQRLQVAAPFDRAWRQVGLALDRGAFTVEDRDRSQGVYFVRYIDPEVEAKNSSGQGWFARTFKFGDSRPTSAQQYRIRVQAQGEASMVGVQLRDGQPPRAENDRQTASKILALLREQLQ